MACVPGAIAVAPACTVAGVFGIVRTTCVPSGSRDSIAETGTPAATEMTSCVLRTSLPMSVSTLSMT